MTGQPTSLEVADAKIKELRAVIREANEMLKEYKLTLREGREFLAKDIKDEVDEKFGEVAKQNIDNWSKHVREAMDASVTKIYKEFDALQDLLMGRDRSSIRHGRESIPDLIEKKVSIDNEAPPNS